MEDMLLPAGRFFVHMDRGGTERALPTLGESVPAQAGGQPVAC